MSKIALRIETKVDGKAVNLSLTEDEVLTGHSICEKNNVETVIVMKKHNGGALFFINPANANNAQQRHNFKYAFDVDAKDLKVEAEKVLKARAEKKDK